MGPVEPQSDSPAIVNLPRPTYSNKIPTPSLFSGKEVPGKYEISFEQ